MRNVSIDGREIGTGAPAFIVAEGGINHQGDLEVALELIRAADEAGADGIKFQKRSLDRILTQSGLAMPYEHANSFGRTYGEHKAALELCEDDWLAMRDEAERRGLFFFGSVWDEESADFCERIGAPLFKIASADVTNLPLVLHVARKGRPVIVSTGMSDLEEVDNAVRVLRAAQTPHVILQCTSTYPTRDADVHLRAMELLRARYGCPVGYSGHEVGIEVSLAAAALGACVIERHLTLDKRMKGGDHAASLEPHELAALVRGVRRIESALGHAEKACLPAERPVRRKLAKSLVTTVAITAGQRIEEWMLTTKGPGTGFSPDRLGEVLGRIAARGIPEDVVLTEDDLIPTLSDAYVTRVSGRRFVVGLN